MIWVSAFATTCFLYVLSKYLPERPRVVKSNNNFKSFYQSMEYVLLVLFSQGNVDLYREGSIYFKLMVICYAKGGVCFSTRITIRIVAGVWCLATFVLVNAYNSTVVSLLTTPEQKPLIDSVYDIPGRPNVKLVINKGMAADLILSVMCL